MERETDNYTKSEKRDEVKKREQEEYKKGEKETCKGILTHSQKEIM